MEGEEREGERRSGVQTGRKVSYTPGIQFLRFQKMSYALGASKAVGGAVRFTFLLEISRWEL